MRRLAVLAVCVLASACEDAPAPADGAASPWTLGPAMPGPRLEPGVTAIGQRVIVLGGFDQSLADGLRITSDVIAYDNFDGAWLRLRDAPVAWTHANLAASGATLYLLGGAEGTEFTARGETYALDLDRPDATWRMLAPLPAGEERSAAGVIVAAPYIYLVGGASTTTSLASVLAYNLATDTWSTLPALPAPRSHPATMVLGDGTLIAAGGLETLASSSARADVWELRPQAAAWTPRAEMPIARGGCASGVVFGQLICAGGEAGAAALHRVDRYDPLADAWSQLADLPDERAGTQGAVVGGRLFVPGGARTLTFQPTDTLYMFAFLESIDPG